jgi:putative endonuclease
MTVLVGEALLPCRNPTKSLTLSMDKGGYVYIITNKHNTTLYTGVTSDLRARLWDHKTGFYPKSFSARYNLHKLVYYETFGDIEAAIAREKYIKGKSRAYKEQLIAQANTNWDDLGIAVEEW